MQIVPAHVSLYTFTPTVSLCVHVRLLGEREAALAGDFFVPLHPLRGVAGAVKRA